MKNAPAPRTLTAAVNEEIRRHRFIALAQNTDTTLSQHPLTYIGPTGIYTGTLTALQVNAVDIDATSIRTGTLSADRLAAGSIKAEKARCGEPESIGHQYGLYQRVELHFQPGKNRGLDDRRGQSLGPVRWALSGRPLSNCGPPRPGAANGIWAGTSPWGWP